MSYGLNQLSRFRRESDRFRDILFLYMYFIGKVPEEMEEWPVMRNLILNHKN